MEKILREKLHGGKFNNVPLLRSKMMSAVRGKGNKTTELQFCSALERAGIAGWSLHERIVGNPDIYFPLYEIAIFLDGCFWHGCPECGHIPKTNNTYWQKKIERNKERDYQNELILQDQGYLVIRFWEHQLLDDIDGCIGLLRDEIENRLLRLSSLML